MFDTKANGMVGAGEPADIASLPVNERRCVEAPPNKSMLEGTTNDLATLQLTASAYEALAIGRAEWPERLRDRHGSASDTDVEAEGLPHRSAIASAAEATTSRAATAINSAADTTVDAAALTLRPGTKGAAVLALLPQPGGATLPTMQAATAWQAHSVRGFLSGTVRKKLQRPLTSTKDEGSERCYWIATPDGAEGDRNDASAACEGERIEPVTPTKPAETGIAITSAMEASA